jgi:uncharacterized protein (UPF0332 family)
MDDMVGSLISLAIDAGRRRPPTTPRAVLSANAPARASPNGPTVSPRSRPQAIVIGAPSLSIPGEGARAARQFCYAGAEPDGRLAMATAPALGLRKRQRRRVDDALPARYRARLLSALPAQIERILLFGSRARGEAHADSDWDFAVFLDHEPTRDDRERIRAIDGKIGHACGDLVQSHVFASQKWLATDELACNIRDQGLILHGPDHVPVIERPVLEHAQAALAKAERYGEQAAQAVPQAYETVVHNSYYAMFHAARAALLAVEGSASTNHGRVVETFARMAKRQRGKALREHATTLEAAYKLRIEADYGNKDLTEVGRQLRERVAPFLSFCHKIVDQQAGKG